jgi:hypothetical protein
MYPRDSEIAKNPGRRPSSSIATRNSTVPGVYFDSIRSKKPLHAAESSSNHLPPGATGESNGCRKAGRCHGLVERKVRKALFCRGPEIKRITLFPAQHTRNRQVTPQLRESERRSNESSITIVHKFIGLYTENLRKCSSLHSLVSLMSQSKIQVSVSMFYYLNRLAAWRLSNSNVDLQKVFSLRRFLIFL